ncbi:chemotaxis protein CheR [Phenylobacterium sp. Root77]|nr:chemotaxis protein CheR [Phenylobacterium sp. Root1277]KQW89649.1 chemotaxis protein CheR [Phenylobacterium sp. Root1290]KRC43482.1 chemotaxis protein CheR [Phenylobacterium sp. Root77]
MSIPPLAPILTAEELRSFSAFLYERTGMTFGETKRYYIERRLLDRVNRSGAGTVVAYLARLRHDSAEQERIVSACTVNETYFFRETQQLQALSNALLPKIANSREPGDRIRIWSVPCSTGEEPYSIAIWLLENWPLVDAYNVEIVGSDVDLQALAAAREGRFGSRALSRLPEKLVSDYFEPAARGAKRIIGDLRESVTFTAANLVDAASIRSHGRFDVIFCRNVLIYFDNASRALAAHNLHDALTPGGYLCLGHSESMGRLDGRFAAVRMDDATVYQRA